MKLLVLAALAFGACRLRAQVVDVMGGTSTLFQSQGGTVTVHGGSYAASAGAGIVGGQFVAGAQLVKSTERAKFTLGIDNIPFDLPTDIFETGHYLTAAGLGVTTKVGNSKLYAFAGETSTAFNSPFFTGAQPATPAGMLFVTGKVAPQWTASTRVIVSQKVTVLHSFAYDDGDGVKFALSGGIGSNRLYSAVSLAVSKEWLDVKAAYYEASDQFRRADVQTPLTSEPDKENVMVTVHPTKYFSFGGGRQNYLTPVYGTDENEQSSVNQAMISAEVFGVSLSATALESTYGDSGDTAQIYSASRQITSRVQMQATYLESRQKGVASSTNDIVANVVETLSPRWTLTQTVNSSNGQTTVGFGGSFLSNIATISANYQTYYVPVRVTYPFEQALIINAQLHVFGRLTLQGGTFVGPSGQLLYTAQAEGIVSRDMGPQSAYQHYPIGPMMVRGRVVDIAGQPVMGAALMLDQLPVYSDSAGYFYIRERKSHAHALTVLVNQFLNGGSYHVVSAPVVAVSSNNENQVDAVVVVERVSGGS